MPNIKNLLAGISQDSKSTVVSWGLKHRFLEYIEHIMVQGHFEASYWFDILAPPHRVFMSLDKAN